MTPDAQRARAQQSNSSNQLRFPFCFPSMLLQVRFMSLNRILAQTVVEKLLFLFLAFNNAQSAMVLVVGHGGAFIESTARCSQTTSLRSI